MRLHFYILQDSIELLFDYLNNPINIEIENTIFLYSTTSKINSSEIFEISISYNDYCLLLDNPKVKIK